ncbi:acylphosphatase [Patescibacteria group bacterium]|nr:acylphosphatase [Patescibacteria group bacterium]
MQKTYEIKIYGRVQGVNFRRTAAWRARMFGVVGFVRNEPDGSVFVEAEGDEECLGKFLAWCRKGSLLAKVERIDVSGIETKNYKEFKIQR